MASIRHHRLDQNSRLLPGIFFLLTTSSTFATSASPPRACEMSTVASTPLLDFLQRLQEAALAAFGPRNFDPKLYVDLSLRSDIDAVERAFAGLPRSPDGSVPAGDLERFIAAHLGAAGSDLVYAQPADFVPEPEGFLPRVRNPAVRAWALEVHALWPNLSRRVDDAVRERPDWHTLIPLPGPVIVPGSRFREVNYWDSYWIIRVISGDDDLPRGLGWTFLDCMSRDNNYYLAISLESLCLNLEARSWTFAGGERANFGRLRHHAIIHHTGKKVVALVGAPPHATASSMASRFVIIGSTKSPVSFLASSSIVPRIQPPSEEPRSKLAPRRPHRAKQKPTNHESPSPPPSLPPRRPLSTPPEAPTMSSSSSSSSSSSAAAAPLDSGLRR
ncbi:hypothetical protein NL676_009958 [Syzygium grande]|nr:hypothetical protein NL676_009958 [Syzygium grande]